MDALSTPTQRAWADATIEVIARLEARENALRCPRCGRKTMQRSEIGRKVREECLAPLCHWLRRSVL